MYFWSCLSRYCPHGSRALSRRSAGQFPFPIRTATRLGAPSTATLTDETRAGTTVDRSDDGLGQISRLSEYLDALEYEPCTCQVSQSPLEQLAFFEALEEGCHAASPRSTGTQGSGLFLRCDATISGATRGGPAARDVCCGSGRAQRTD